MKNYFFQKCEDFIILLFKEGEAELIKRKKILEKQNTKVN